MSEQETEPRVTGPVIPRREAWLDVPEYPGFRVKLWLNYPRRLREDINSRDEARISAAARQIVLEHNGWVDFDGLPYPPANTEEFWAEIPTELATVLMYLALEEVGAILPKSLAQSRRR